VQFEPEWSTFVGGPPLLEAFRAGELDVGFVGDTPPLFAAAAGQDLVIVAAWRFDGDNYGIVVGPDSDVGSVEELKGKSVAFQKGTAMQAYTVRALDEADLEQSDIEHVDLSSLDVSAAVKSGDADAGVLVEPLLSQYLASTPGAKKIRDSKGLTTNLSFIITTREALEDPAKAAAVGDFLRRQRAAFAWSAANRDVLVDAFATNNNVPADLARQIIEGNAGTEFLPLAGPVTDQLQSLADDLYEAKVIPKELDAPTLFDSRFEAITTGPLPS
ncbi:MAG TPA: PhnD/SsuA/transferrin family substrate-binding protein, partial [Microthrixaceae bacterium]|nr:PhnD/SsuA/transferrin family substrate-binding protein [Microthrixaceae bacterium]